MIPLPPSVVGRFSVARAGFPVSLSFDDARAQAVDPVLGANRSRAFSVALGAFPATGTLAVPALQRFRFEGV